MRIFIDTNVLIDLLLKRTPFYADTAQLFEIAIRQKFPLVISNLSIVNAHYVVRKAGIAEAAARTALQNICSTCEIAPFTVGITLKALASPFTDFEDATQYYCAIENNCDVLITRNANDFKLSAIPVMNASEWLIALQSLPDTVVLKG